jgi:hypothetical protein
MACMEEDGGEERESGRVGRVERMWMCLGISVKSALIGDAGGEGGGCGVRATSAGEACVKTIKCECPSFPPVIS